MSQDAVKLQRLFMSEVSGVDDPANELPGWMVMKANRPTFTLGPDTPWEVGAAEKRIRVATGATEAPNSQYAACYLHKSNDGEAFGDYKFLVCDVVDGGIKLMPAALDAAQKRLSSSSLSDVEKSSVSDKIEALTTEPVETTDAEAHSILKKIREIFSGTSPNEGDFDMDAEALKAVVAEAIAPVAEQVAELQKSVEAAPVTEGANESTAEETPALTLDEITKALKDEIEVALAPYNEILEKILDRQEAVEKSFAGRARKSLEGQERNDADGDETPSTPNLGDAIAKAFAYPSSVRVVTAADAAGQ